MPFYVANDTEIRAIAPGDRQNVIVTADVISAGKRSRAVAIQQAGPVGLAGISASGEFSGAPGVFEIDVEIADVDQESSYVAAAGAVVNTVNANNSWRCDVPSINAKFARLKIVALANVVTMNARLGR